MESGETTLSIVTDELGADVCGQEERLSLTLEVEKPEASAVNSFTDVETGMWYDAPINWAVGTGVTKGMTETRFGIDANCNRAQAVTFLYRALAQ